MRKLIGCIALGVLVAACSSLAPLPIRTGDVCFRCVRVITDERLGGELISPNGLMSKFRTSGCMAKYLARNADDSARLYFVDYDTGKFITAKTAVFVPFINRDTGERDYHVYAKGPVAEAAAREGSVRPVEWAQVLELARLEDRGN